MHSSGPVKPGHPVPTPCRAPTPSFPIKYCLCPNPQAPAGGQGLPPREDTTPARRPSLLVRKFLHRANGHQMAPRPTGFAPLGHGQDEAFWQRFESSPPSHNLNSFFGGLGLMVMPSGRKKVRQSFTNLPLYVFRTNSQKLKEIKYILRKYL